MADVSHLDHPNLYRAIKNRTWFDVQSAAFKLRDATEKNPAETHLSVILSANCTKSVCDALQNRCFGEFVLDTRSVTSRWSVESDDPESPNFSPNHASIGGLPLFGSDELAIEEAASDLADLITAEHRRPT
jgi:hypothetical protein